MSQKTLSREETDRQCTGKIISQKTLFREDYFTGYIVQGM